MDGDWSLFPDRQRLIQQIEALEQRAHELKMPIAARGLNNAKNTAGWELAGDVDGAAKALRGE